MLKLEHYDDGKGSYQSHEIRINRESIAKSFTENSLCWLSEITGYGATKEEALYDLKMKFHKYRYAVITIEYLLQFCEFDDMIEL